ncbi:MAG: cupin domain-containing protein [Actinomycetota bacterium]
MGKVSRQTASQHESGEGFEGHYAEVGPYTIGFEEYSVDADISDMFKGLPDDMCQAEHWGYVIKGKLVFNYADGTSDEISGGEAYFAPSGHTPVLTADTQVVEFSPTDKLAETMAVVMKNMEAAG